MLEEIPVVHRGMDADTNAETILRAFRDIGFVFIHEPELSQRVSAAYGSFRAFFQLTPDVKRRYAMPDLFYQRGWTPPFTEKAIACRGRGPRGADIADAKEAWFMGPWSIADESLRQRYPQLYPENIWPDEVPQLRTDMQELYGLLSATGRDVLAAVQRGMDLPPGYFDDITRDAPTVMRAIHYPPVAVREVGKIVWACEHTDINLVTVLPASTAPGLWIRRRDGEWIPGAAPERCVIVQVADMLDYLTGGQLMSAAHEVRAPDHPTTEGRYSAALFMHARSDVLLDPKATGPDAAMYPPITAGSLLQRRLRDIGLA